MFRQGTERYDITQPLPDEFFERSTLRSKGRLLCLQQGLTVHRIRSDSQNLSSQRVRSNIRGAWSHFRLTRYRDLPGLFMFLALAYVPEGFRWWFRRRVTLRRARWFTVAQFDQQFHFYLT